MEIFKVSKSHIHLLLADDSILFLKATKNNATVTQQILSEYCEASRQLVNLVKSSIFFCKACPQTVCDEMRLITKVENESLNEKYLGLPTDVGRMSNGAFKYLKDRVWNKVQGWLEKTFIGWREVSFHKGSGRQYLLTQWDVLEYQEGYVTMSIP